MSSFSEVTNAHQRRQRQPTWGTTQGHRAKAMPAVRQERHGEFFMRSQYAVGTTATVWQASEVEISS
jgi:hypothetical protein